MNLDKNLLVKTFEHGYEKILGAIKNCGIDEETANKLLNDRLSLPERVDSIEKLLQRLLISAQNASGKPNIIGMPILGINNLSDTLCGFNPGKIIDEYKCNKDEPSKTNSAISILKKINENFPNLGLTKTYGRNRTIAGGIEKKRKEPVLINAFDDPLNTWNKYVFTINDAAVFFKSYKDVDCFYAEADKSMKKDIHDFPNKMAKEISGIGYALACDFLKEVGVDCGKPDVHIKAILEGVCNKENLNNQQLQNAMNIIAEEKKITLFAVDKVFWLIGTTRFGIQICDYRRSFINECINNKI